MVNNMKTLFYLWYLKTKGTVRNLMKKPSSAIFTVFVVLLYGFIFVSLFLFKDKNPMIMTTGLHTSILILIAFYTHVIKESTVLWRGCLFLI